MNIGIYVRTLADRSPASARFQETILDGLQQLRDPRFHFVVLSEEIPPGYEDTAQISYVRVARPSAADATARKRKLLLGGLCRRLLRAIGAESSGAYGRLTRWLAYEEPYFAQLRKLDIRLLWNLGVDVLPCPLPYVMVVWDLNYRIHSMFPEYSYVTNGYEFFDKTTPLLRSASYVVVGTEQGKRETVEMLGVYSGKIRVIPFPTPQLPDGGEAGFGPDAGPYIFYPARFWPHKNHVVLVHALALLRERWGVEVRCIFSGINNGNLDYVLRIAESLGVRRQIEYLGNVPAAQLAALYRDAAALVYCSAVGPDNFPPLEAMSVGCPVIAADVPGAREQYGDAALLFERTNEEVLAHCIWRLLNERGLRETLVERGAKRAASWTRTDYARGMIAVLDEFSRVARMWDGAAFTPKTLA